MAGAGAHLWVAAEEVTAANMNQYLQDQVTMRFASTAARDAAFGGVGEPVLAEGMFAYTSDTNTLWFYTGSAWEVATIKPSLVDAKGDLLAGTAADTVDRLAVGTNGQVLVANSAASTGLAWQSLASSATNAIVNTGQATSSVTYTDLPTAGPAVTVTTGTSALVLITAGMRMNVASAGQYISFAISGATTVAASDNFAAYHQSDAGTYAIWGASMAVTVTGLTAGSNTFTTKYRTSSGTANFYTRSITVWPL